MVLDSVYGSHLTCRNLDTFHSTCNMLKYFKRNKHNIIKRFLSHKMSKGAGNTQRWAKGPIDRFSDTDSIFRLYRTIQSVDVKFRFLYRPIVSVRFEFRFFNRPILFLGLKFRFLYRPIVSVRFEFRFFNRPILFLGFKFRFFYRAMASFK